MDLNTVVLSDEQRAAAADPVIQRLIPLIPRANTFDADGTPRFVGSAPAVADHDRFTIDVKHHTRRKIAFRRFTGVSGFARSSRPHREIMSPGSAPHRGLREVCSSVSATQVFGTTLLNEARFGRSRLDGGTFVASPLNPEDFGIRNGVTNAIGLPQMIVAGAVNFGGPGTLPQGRFDTSYVVTDTLSRAKGGTLDQVRRRIPAFHQRELRRRHRGYSIPERGRIPQRNGQCVQHHARREAERD